MSDSKACWALEFARHLHKVMPGVDGSTAAQIGQFMWQHDAARSPQQSAEQFAGRNAGMEVDDLISASRRPGPRGTGEKQ